MAEQTDLSTYFGTMAGMPQPELDQSAPMPQAPDLTDLFDSWKAARETTKQELERLVKLQEAVSKPMPQRVEEARNLILKNDYGIEPSQPLTKGQKLSLILGEGLGALGRPRGTSISQRAMFQAQHQYDVDAPARASIEGSVLRVLQGQEAQSANLLAKTNEQNRKWQEALVKWADTNSKIKTRAEAQRLKNDALEALWDHWQSQEDTANKTADAKMALANKTNNDQAWAQSIAKIELNQAIADGKVQPNTQGAVDFFMAAQDEAFKKMQQRRSLARPPQQPSVNITQLTDAEGNPLGFDKKTGALQPVKIPQPQEAKYGNVTIPFPGRVLRVKDNDTIKQLESAYGAERSEMMTILQNPDTVAGGLDKAISPNVRSVLGYDNPAAFEEYSRNAMNTFAQLRAMVGQSNRINQQEIQIAQKAKVQPVASARAVLDSTLTLQERTLENMLYAKFRLPSDFSLKPTFDRLRQRVRTAKSVADFQPPSTETIIKAAIEDYLKTHATK